MCISRCMYTMYICFCILALTYILAFTSQVYAQRGQDALLGAAQLRPLLSGFAPLSADLSGSNIIQDPDISQHVAVEGELRESFAALFAAHARHMTKRIKYQGDMRLRQAYLCTVATCNGC